MSVEAIGAAARALTKALDNGPGIVPDATVLADFLQALFEEGYCVARIERPEVDLMVGAFQRELVPAAPALPITSTGIPDEIPF